MLPAPAAAEVVAETVAVVLDPDFTLAGLKVTVTPLGAVALSVTGWVYPLVADTATVKVAVSPCNILTEDDAGLSVSTGASIVTGTLAVAVYVPLTPLMLMVPLPAATVAAAERVSVMDAPVLMLAVLRATVSPLGAVAFKVTVPL